MLLGNPINHSPASNMAQCCASVLYGMSLDISTGTWNNTAFLRRRYWKVDILSGPCDKKEVQNGLPQAGRGTFISELGADIFSTFSQGLAIGIASPWCQHELRTATSS